MTYQLMMKQKNKVKWDLNNKAIWNIPLGIQIFQTGLHQKHQM